MKLACVHSLKVPSTKSVPAGRKCTIQLEYLFSGAANVPLRVASGRGCRALIMVW